MPYFHDLDGRRVWEEDEPSVSSVRADPARARSPIDGWRVRMRVRETSAEHGESRRFLDEYYSTPQDTAADAAREWFLAQAISKEEYDRLRAEYLAQWSASKGK